MKDKYSPPLDIPKIAYEDYSSFIKDDKAFSGESVVIGDGEYLQVERSDDGISISWTSPIGIRGLVEYADKNTQLIPAGDGQKSFVEIENGSKAESSEGTAREVIDFITSEDSPVSYVRIEYDKLALLWSSPAARIKDSDQIFAEVAIVTQDRNQELIESIIKSVGSQSIQKHYDEVIGELKEAL